MPKQAKKVEGGAQSIRKSLIARLEGLYEARCEKGRFLPEGALALMAEVSAASNKEIAAMIDRRGIVQSVSVGDDRTVGLADMDKRRGTARTSGIRCVHTHPNGDPLLSDIDLASLSRLRLDAMVSVAVGPGGRVLGAQAAIKPVGKDARLFGPYLVDGEGPMPSLEPLHEALDKILPEIFAQEREVKAEAFEVTAREREKAVLVCAQDGTDARQEELSQLALTAGAEVMATVSSRERAPDPAYHIGRGKVDELSLVCQKHGADIVVFDAELSGAQARNIEDAVGARAVDRTTLILDIFAQRARSREGKMQVELAQLNYRLPRLTGKGTALSRLGGGIGTRGPGERKLDVDRRHIRRRINHIEKELSQLHGRRGQLRRSSGMAHAPVVALVGYTNAGKSTLFNALCGADAFTEDKLFATLDPTARRLDLPSGGSAMLVDTVGFIRNLPHDLVEAFKATLEETAHADVLLHVADASSPELDSQMETVRRILDGISARAYADANVSADADADVNMNAYANTYTNTYTNTNAYANANANANAGARRGRRKAEGGRGSGGVGGAGGAAYAQKTIVALNKIDKLKGGPASIVAARGEAVCEISALTGEGLGALRALIEDAVSEGGVRVSLLIPYSDGGALAYVRSCGSVFGSEFREEGVEVDALMSKELLGRVKGYVIRPAQEIVHKQAYGRSPVGGRERGLAGQREHADPRDKAVPREQAAPHDKAVPREQAVPHDKAVPREQAGPRDKAVPREQAGPHDKVGPHEFACAGGPGA